MAGRRCILIPEISDALNVAFRDLALVCIRDHRYGILSGYSTWLRAMPKGNPITIKGSKQLANRAEREFGLVVGGILILLSLWWVYRGKFTVMSRFMLPIGGLLVLLGLLFPRILRLPNRAWMALAEVMAYASSHIILAIIFFFVVTPTGVIKRLFGWDPLNRRSHADDSYWRPYSERQRDPRHYERMF